MNLSNDLSYKRYRQTIQRIKERLDIDHHMEEVDIMIGKRKSPLLMSHKDRYNPRIVYDAEQTDLSIRSRLSRLLGNFSHYQILLDETVNSFADYLTTVYRDELTGNRGEKTSQVNYICRHGLQLQSKLDAIIILVRNTIEDIDKVGYHYTNTVKLLEILYNRKEGL